MPGSGAALLTLLATLLAVPVVLVAGTVFAKLLIVLGILRHGLGTPRIPPGVVLTALAALLGFLVMEPTLDQMQAAAGPLEEALASPGALVAARERSLEPLVAFVAARTREADRRWVAELATRLRTDGQAPNAPAVAITAFALGELRNAFVFGLILLLPFLVLDLVVAHSLLSAGLTGLAPNTVALPFKLLLFVLVDGWALLARALLLS